MTQQEGVKFQQEVTKVMPFGKPIPSSFSTDLATTVGSSYYGFTPTMRHLGTEAHGLPCLRYNVVGDRSVLTLPIVVALHMFVEKSGVDAPTPPLDHLLTFLSKLTTDEGLAIVAKMQPADQACIVSARIGSDTCLYIPGGHIIFEQTLNNAVVVGIRIACIA